MAGIIQIRDKECGFLTVTLQDLLAFFEHAGANRIWSIQDLEAVGDPAKLKVGVLDIEQQAKQSPQGFILKFEELVELAQALTDVWNAWIVTVRDGESIPKVIHSFENLDQYEAVIEAFDSAWWRIFAQDDAIIQKLADHFHDVTITQL